MLSPRPAPPADVRPRARSPRQKRSQKRDCSWAGIPGPSLATIISAQRVLRCAQSRAGVQAESGRIRGEQVVARPSAHHYGGAIALAGHGTARGGGAVIGGLAGQPREVNRLVRGLP
jgi:hypothetical protein